MGKSAGGHSSAHHHGCHNINVQRFSKLLVTIALAFIPGDSKSWESPDEVDIVWKLFIQILFR